MHRNPNWTRDEVILALDLYFRLDSFPSNEQHPEVIELSRFLNELPIHLSREHNFRNPNGVYMKLCNFMYLDPDNPDLGLDAHSKLDEEIWKKYADQRELLRDTAEAIRRNYQEAKTIIDMLQPDTSENEGYSEGRVLEIIHRARERNSTLIRRKKETVLAARGKLECEVCKFDFSTRYGELGYGFAECHHKVPLSQLRPNTKTRLEDLALVCANCHRMIHRPGAPTTFDEFVFCYSTNKEA